MKFQEKLIFLCTTLFSLFLFTACACQEDDEHYDCDIEPDYTDAEAGYFPVPPVLVAAAISVAAVPALAEQINTESKSGQSTTLSGTFNPEGGTGPGGVGDSIFLEIPQDSPPEPTDLICPPGPQPSVGSDISAPNYPDNLVGIPNVAEEFEGEDLTYSWQISRVGSTEKVQFSTVQEPPFADALNAIDPPGRFEVLFQVTDPCGTSGSDTLILTAN